MAAGGILPAYYKDYKIMTNFPNASDKAVRRLLDQSKGHLFNLAEQMKIENLSEEFLAEIVTPISLYLSLIHI